MSLSSIEMNNDGYNTWQLHTTAETESSRPTKRTRVALACQRCKTRKQKCNGARPSCKKCYDLGVTCEYIPTAKPFGKSHYLKALEERVAELESYLAKHGIQEVGSDHWQYIPCSNESDDGNHLTGDVEVRHAETPFANGHEGAPASREFDESDKGEYQIDTMISILRDLSLDANGGYMGGTAHITVGKLVGSIVKGKNSARRSSARSSIKDHLHPKVIEEDDFEQTDSAFTWIPAFIAERCLTGFMKHVSTSFPVIHSVKVFDLHRRRNGLDNVYEICTLHLVYAIGGRFLETAGESGPFFHERHHGAALKLLDEILQFHDSRSVQTLMLLAIYCLRAPQGPGAWTYVGLAMRIAIDLGLHRRTSAMNTPSLDNELRKRLFWSCYNLDRQVSIPLGRPFAISDREIDIPLPLDIDEGRDDIGTVELASPSQNTTAPTLSTTLSLFIHVTKLRMIESDIQQKIYRVDSAVEATDMEIDTFATQLLEWRNLIPLDSQNKHESDGTPVESYEHYMTYYYQALRLLLYPQISRSPVNPRYLKECAEACGGVCRTYKELHQQESIGYSLMALQAVFMAGLTLIYCTWMDPDLIFNTTTSNDINSCSIVLFVITERWPGAKKYRNAFEVVKKNIIDRIAEGKHFGPRQAVVELKMGLQSALDNMQGDEDQQDECSNILTDMAGERIAVEQRRLLLSDTSNARPDIVWPHRPAYGMFSSEHLSMWPYETMNFDNHTGTGLSTAQTHLTDISDGFDIGDMSKFPDWT